MKLDSEIDLSFNKIRVQLQPPLFKHMNYLYSKVTEIKPHEIRQLKTFNQHLSADPTCDPLVT